MRRFALGLLVAATALLSACTTRTQYGECIGIGDDKKPDLEYKLDVWNTFLGIAFFETLFTPIVVLANEAYCPVGKK